MTNNHIARALYKNELKFSNYLNREIVGNDLSYDMEHLKKLFVYQYRKHDRN